MKKLLSIIAAVAFCFAANSQNPVFSESFDRFTGKSSNNISDTINNRTETPGWAGVRVYPWYGKAKMGTSSALGSITTPAIDLSANGGTFTVVLKIGAWANDETSVNVYVNDVLSETITDLPNPTTNGAPNNKDNENPELVEKIIVFSGGTTATRIKFEGKQANRGRFFLDSLVIYNEGSFVDNEAPVIQGATAVNDTTVRVTFNENVTSATASVVSNYSIDNGVTVSAATVVNSKVVTLTTSTLVAGTTYTVTASGIADEAGNTATSILKEFTVISATEIANLTELWTVIFADMNGDSNGIWDADTSVFTGTKIYKITGPVAVTALGSQRNQKWVQDYSYYSKEYDEYYESGVLIDDPNGKLTSEIEVGNTLTGLVGTLTYYNDLIEFVPVADVAPDATPAFTVEPYEISLEWFGEEDAQDYFWDYQSCLVKLSNVYFKDNVTLKNGSNYAMCSVPNGSGSDIVDSAVRVHIYNTVTYTTNNKLAVNVTGVLVIDKFGMMRVSPRFTADIEGDGVSTENVVLRSKNSALRLSPVPVKDELTVTMNGATSVDVYSLNGTLVAEKRGVSGSTKINVASLAHGIYFVKATDKAGKTSIKKFIKK